MLQIANAFFKLPGDYLKPGEEEVQGLKERLNHILAPLDERGNPTEGDWEIGDCIAQWWRPNFETFMVSLVMSLKAVLKLLAAFHLLFYLIPTNPKSNDASFSFDFPCH